jgi:hypothetical protein
MQSSHASSHVALHAYKYREMCLSCLVYTPVFLCALPALTHSPVYIMQDVETLLSLCHLYAMSSVFTITTANFEFA